MNHCVYLAGPIAGLNYSGATEWREQVTAQLAEVGIKGLSPMRAKDYLAGVEEFSKDCHAEGALSVLSKPRSIMTRDRFDATRCDVMLVNLLGAERVSIGTVMEIAWADLSRIPIVCAMEKGATPALMSNEQRAWLAAMIDGEGHIAISPTTSPSRGSLKNISYQVRIKVAMTSEEVVTRIANLTGFGSVRPLAARPDRRQMYGWQCVGLEAKRVLEEIFPHLIAKTAQAAIALEMATLKEANRGQSVPGHQGFKSKSPEQVAAEADAYSRYRKAMAGDSVSFRWPALPTFPNVHAHGMVAEAIGVPVRSLEEAVHAIKAILL